MSKRSARTGRGDGQYVPVPYAMLKSDAWRDLSGNALKVWFEIHVRYHGGNNGRLTLSYAEAVDALGIGKASVKRAFDELVSHGFLVRGSWYGRRANEWRLTTKPVQGLRSQGAASNEWRDWRSPKTEVGADAEPSVGDTVPSQNRTRANGTGPEPVRDNFDPVNGSHAEH